MILPFFMLLAGGFALGTLAETPQEYGIVLAGVALIITGTIL